MTKPQITPVQLRSTSPDTEYSVAFLQGMLNRMSVSFHKYGPLADAYPDKVSALKSLDQRVEKYLETGNTEYLIDAANFCLEPGARVWMRDLSLRPIGDLRPGDQVIGFTEEAVTRRTQRAWCSSTVVAVTPLKLPRARVLTKDGPELVTSLDHRWLAAHRNGPGWSYSWLETGRDERSGMRQHKRHYVPLIAPLTDELRDYDSGWLSGFLDGEGHASQSGGRLGTVKVVWGQNPGAIRDRVRSILEDRGYDVAEHLGRRCVIGSVRGGIWESLRLLMETRPQRLLDQLDPDRWGAVRQHAVHEVLAVEELPPGDVVAVETTSGTFVAEGYGHHNCMIEFLRPSLADAFFEGTDSDGSPGRTTVDGTVTSGKNAAL